jgi:hypothetical protein
MPFTARTVQYPTPTGITPVYTAVDNANGEVIPNNGMTWAHFKNSGGASCTVTVAIQRVVEGQAVSPLTITVPAGGEKITKTFSPNFSDPAGLMYFSFSTGSGVTAAYFSQ